MVRRTQVWHCTVLIGWDVSHVVSHPHAVLRLRGGSVRLEHAGVGRGHPVIRDVQHGNVRCDVSGKTS